MRRNQGYIGQAWLVLLLAVCFGGALALVHIGWKDRIEENKRNKTYDAIPQLVEGAAKELTETLSLPDMTVYKAFAAGRAGGKRHAGWVLRTSGQGFADRIELLVALDAPAEKILGIYVLDQKETPGLGDKISPNGAWDKQFRPTKDSSGRIVSWLEATEDVQVGKEASMTRNQIAAITGATVSSRSVTTIVNKAIIEFRNAMIRGELKAGKD